MNGLIVRDEECHVRRSLRRPNFRRTEVKLVPYEDDLVFGQKNNVHPIRYTYTFLIGTFLRLRR